MEQLAARVAEAFATLPARYLGAEPGFDATYLIRLGDIGRCWEVRCTALGARVRAGATQRRPDVVIGTDAETWCALREGELSGIEAFSQRRLYARGDLDLAVGFEGLFRLPSGRPPLLRIHDVPVGRLKLSTLTMGEGPDMLLLTGWAGRRPRSTTLRRACRGATGSTRSPPPASAAPASRPRRRTAPPTTPRR